MTVVDLRSDLMTTDAARSFIGGDQPIARSTLWRGVKSGRYPPPIKIGANAVRWRRSELEAAVERLAQARGIFPAKPDSDAGPGAA